MAAHEKGSLYALGWIEMIPDTADTLYEIYNSK